MNSVLLGVLALLCFILPSYEKASAHGEKRDIYVVYMGGVPDDGGSGSSSGVTNLKESHFQLLYSVLKGQNAENMLVHSYGHGFSGFAARLTKEEAATIRRRSDVVSVFIDPILELHTTRSWDFLQQTSLETDSSPASDLGSSVGATDTIIGLLDTGIWPESESFSDSGLGPIPSRWKGTCMKGPDFNSSNCNKKLIGARYYNTDHVQPTLSVSPKGSPRDELGHGTHTSSTAAGSPVLGASYYGLAAGTAKGGSTSSRIAMYKVCGFFGCPGSAILAGFDDAIADGVDLLSVSLGASAFNNDDFSHDPIAIGSFHAVAKGITVVCSAGNDGPGSRTVVNTAPWILTVAATTIDRNMESDILLGGKKDAIKGEAINFSDLDKSPVYPLIYGGSARTNSSTDDTSSSHCEPDSLDGNKIKGKIVLCQQLKSDTSKKVKILELNNSGAVGAILINDLERAVASAYIGFTVTEIPSEAANDILSYINSTIDPVATILPTITVSKYKPAPSVAYFSSRGPSTQTSNILKPDVAAPGVNILASWIPGSSAVPRGEKPSSLNIVSGTSMACPHVTGIAATIKAWNPTWSPSAIRSAIMTTTSQVNNYNAALTSDSGSLATPYDYGSGEVSPATALQPGLVYELGATDYIQFLCNYGYNASDIKLITTIPDGFECPNTSSLDLISNLNYPSIAISGFNGKASKIVNRTLTSVGADEATTYILSIKSPPELEVMVVPDKLQFGKNSNKLSYQVTFSASNSTLKGDYFGSITWSDGTHRVRSPFVVST